MELRYRPRTNVHIDCVSLLYLNVSKFYAYRDFDTPEYRYVTIRQDTLQIHPIRLGGKSTPIQGEKEPIPAPVATRAREPLERIVRRHQNQSARVARRQSVREVSEMWWCDCESGFAGFMLCCFMLWWCAPSVVVRAGYMRGWAPP